MKILDLSTSVIQPPAPTMKVSLNLKKLPAIYLAGLHTNTKSLHSSIGCWTSLIRSSATATSSIGVGSGGAGGQLPPQVSSWGGQLYPLFT